MDGFTLTTWQRRRLERQLREAEEVSTYRRTAALLDLARGRAAAAGGRATRPSAGSCGGSGTCGSGSGTSSTRTPSARKKRAIRRLVRGLGARHAVLAEDETDLLLFPPLRAGWALRGQPAEVPLSGRNARRVIFGAMNLGTGHRLFLPRKHGRAADFEAFLDLIHDSYRGWHVALLLDEDPSHTAGDPMTLAWSYEIDLLWLPKRCPQLNPMDTLWGQ